MSATLFAISTSLLAMLVAFVEISFEFVKISDAFLAMSVVLVAMLAVFVEISDVLVAMFVAFVAMLRRIVLQFWLYLSRYYQH